MNLLQQFLSKVKKLKYKKNALENSLKSPKRKPNLFKTDRGKDFSNGTFQTFLNSNNFSHYSRNSSLGAVPAERFNRTIRDFFKDPFLKDVMSIGLMYYPQ